MARKLRLAYTPSVPFSQATTIWLVALYCCGFAGLLAWNIVALAKGLQCEGYSSGDYDKENCAPSTLQFSGTYYTRPVSNAGSQGQIGIYPWSPLGFGNSTGPIDYSFLTLNWTADPLQCVLFQQSLVLHLDSESTTIAASFYCGPYLRVLATTIDSERTQVPAMSYSSYESVASNFTVLSTQAHAIASSFRSGATVLSVRINTQRNLVGKVKGMEAGVLPFTEDLFEVQLGTTAGLFPIDTSNSNAAVALVARAAGSLSNLVEESTTTDLQPAFATSSLARTLQTAYVCNQCHKRRRPVLEMIALIIPAIFGILSPAFGIVKMLAESVAPNRKYKKLEEALACPDPSSVPLGSSTSGPNKVNSLPSTPMGSPSMSQQQQQPAASFGYMPHQSYQSTQSSNAAGGYPTFTYTSQPGYPTYSQPYGTPAP